MTNSRLTNLIRKTNIKKLPTPAVFLVFMIIVFIRTGILELLVPTPMNNASPITELYNNGTRYVHCRMHDLYYSGLNTTDSKGNVTGYFYYFIENNRCYYLLFDVNSKSIHSEDNKLIQHISNADFTAKLTTNQSLMVILNEHLAGKIGWTGIGLTSISSIVLIHEKCVTYGLDYVFLAICLVFCLITMAHIIAISVSIFNVRLSKTVLRLNKYDLDNDAYALCEAEYDGSDRMGKGIIFTSNFLIMYDKHNVHLIPLKEITSAYKYGTVTSKLFNRKLSYSLSVSTPKIKHYIVNHKTKEACEKALDRLQKTNPLINIGYREHSKKQS